MIYHAYYVLGAIPFSGPQHVLGQGAVPSDHQESSYLSVI